MNKQALFSYDSKTDRFRVDFAWAGGNQLIWGDWKYLTNEEIAWLEDAVDFTKIAGENSSHFGYPLEALEPCFEFGELDDSNFATMYRKFENA